MNALINVLLAVIIYSLFAVVPIAAWITHVIVCIKSASWILLLFGCIVFPVGIIHGVGVWMGLF